MANSKRAGKIGPWFWGLGSGLLGFIELFELLEYVGFIGLLRKGSGS